MQNNNYNYEDIVWPFPVPPVCTAFWSNADWGAWIMSAKPNDYKGHPTDKKAWEKYLTQKAWDKFNK